MFLIMETHMEEDEYISAFLDDAITIIKKIDRTQIKKLSTILQGIRNNGGRLFILGVGGGAGHASHAVNDFRKIAGIESYAPTDNVSELTARVNDDGWETVFESWLKGSHLTANDCIFVFSVGGGNAEKKVSVNLVNALRYAKETGAKVIGVIGRDGGYTAKVADACLIIPTVNEKTVTPQTEAFQAIVWHLIVSSPAMQKFEMKWESTK
jgi:D-sedoheptulose 7-phosphate isomerase